MQSLLSLLIVLLFATIGTNSLASQVKPGLTDEGQTSAGHASEDHIDEAHADEEHAEDEESGKLYNPSVDSMADMEATLQKAAAEGKLALIIFGANWCHDSRALATRIYQEPLQTLINESYEPLFIDVGNLSKGREAINSLGVPIYYATPTVLIVDPVSRVVINQGNRHMWGSAASISMQDSVTYFADIAAMQPSPTGEDGLGEQELELMAEIDAFELLQAERLSRAYQYMEPMLEGEFDQDVWSEVARYRNGVAADMDQLRAEASSRIAAGDTDIELVYPSYPEWSWSSDAP
jgi:hypothetical protein